MRRRRSGTAEDRGPDATVRITAAAEPLSDAVARRARRYLVQMSIRTACFVGAVVVDHWTRWLMLAGAVVLPYVAVVMANAGQDRPVDPGTFLAPPALPGPPRPGEQRPGPNGGGR